MNTHPKLVVCGLIAAIILSLLPNPSLAIKSQESTAKPQDPPALVSQLVQERTPNQDISKHFRKYDLIKMDPGAVAAQVRRNGKLVVKSSVRDFELQMAPHDLRAPEYSAQVIDSRGVAHPLPRTEVTTYKGYVKGLTDAQARMSITERGIEGAIFTRQGRYFLQPARSFSKSAGTDEFVVYEGSDLHKHDGSCGVTLADEVAAQEEEVKIDAMKAISAEATGPVSSNTPLKIVRISTDADGEYVSALGGASQANSQITSIINFVDGIYQSEIGLTFQIVQQNTWADAATDPYTSVTANTRLQQFTNHWVANFPNSGDNRRSIAHLFTGVDLNGATGEGSGTIGIAWINATCRAPNLSYGLSQKFPLNTPGINAATVILTAHEIGHNFSGAHTNQVASDVPFDIEQACENTIMEANIGDGPSFCPFSRSQIAGWANKFSSCLDATATPPPTSQDCPTTPMVGNSVSGSLASGDCRSPSRGVEHFADRYSFNGNAGQRLTITMDGTGFDSYLYLIGPDGYFVSQNDDIGAGNTDSRIPTFTGFITLPQTGVYTIEATSFARLATGSYTITINDPACTISVNQGSFHFPAAGGAGTINVTLTGCASDNAYRVAVNPDTASWIVPEISDGTDAVGSRSINFNVAAHSNAAGRRAFLVVGAASFDFSGGLRIPITQSGTGPDCANTPIALGQTVNGTLSGSDCHSPVRGNGFLADRYTFNASAGQRVVIETSATGLDTFLTLLGPNGVVLLTDDDSGAGANQNSRIPGGNRDLLLGVGGTYTIEVTPFDTTGSGSYSLTLTGTNTVGPAPHIVLEESGPAADQAAAFDSLLGVRDPFSVINPGNLFNPSDPNTRVVIFVANLAPSASVTVNLIDNNSQSHDIAAQDVRAVPNVADFVQVTFRLPSNLPVGTCRIRVTSNGNVSNQATFRIKS